MAGVLEMDLEELDFRAALTGLVGLVVVLALISVLGTAGMAAGIAVLFVVAGASDDRDGPDAGQLAFVLVGSLITLAVGYAADSAVAATIVIGLITLVATLLTMLGPRHMTAGVFAVMWAVLTLSITGSDENVGAMALSFLAGGLIALGAMWVEARIPGDDESGAVEPAAGDPAAAGPAEPTPPTGSTTGPDVRTIETFAVLRAVGAAACVAAAYGWFPEHTGWAVLTFVLVLRPPKEQTWSVGIGRTLGTLAGVLLGMGIGTLVGDSTASLMVAFAVCGFLMLATRNVNYALSTTFTTALLLLSQRLLQGDLFASGWERLEATAFGVAVAFVVIGAMALIGRSRPATDGAEPQTT